MKIKLIIFDGKEPTKAEYSGIYALETMINNLLREYYGLRITEKVMDLLRERVKK